MPAEQSKTISRFVIAHMAVVLFNAFAHEQLETYYFISEHLPIIFIFTLLPVIAAWMIKKEKVRQGIMILNGVLGAALVFNIYDRFFTRRLPSLLPVPFAWKILYEASFGTMLILEVLLMWYGIQIVRQKLKT